MHRLTVNVCTCKPNKNVFNGVNSFNKFDYLMEFIMLCYPVREVVLCQWIGVPGRLTSVRGVFFFAVS